MSNKTRPKQLHHAFRVEYSGISGTLVTEVAIGLPTALGSGGGITSFIPYKAIWDTGATHSVITPRVVAALIIMATGKVEVAGVNSRTIVNTYIVDIGLPNKVHFPNWNVSENVLNSPGIDVLIGMDLIQNGDFSIANGNNKTIFSFAMPPFKNSTDLLGKANALNSQVRP